MAVQDKSGGLSLNSIVASSTRIGMDVITPSTNGVQVKEMCSSGDELALKVRKPYTITKQRERWTEEEHKKFLEALKLHGRAWCRIEEYIGTKTAVQIRSHAQKFFSKVARESAGSSTGSVKPIEIPPPRPKRKPVHPYPRKLGHSSQKGIPILELPERSSSVSGQDNRSPTSVLSVVGSDNIGSSFSNLPNCCTSPNSSASGSNPVGTLITEQENQCESCSLSAGEENGSQSPGSVTVVCASQGNSTTKADLISQDNVCPEGSSSVEAPATVLKLFGRTVLVTDSHKPSSLVVGNTPQFRKSLPALDNERHQKDIEMDFESLVQTQPGNAAQSDFCGAPCKGTWNPWPCGAPPLFYCMPFHQELMNATESSTALPWWTFYGGSPIPLFHLHNMNLQQDQASVDKDIQKEVSLTGSYTASVGDKNCDTVNSKGVQASDKERAPAPVSHLKPSENSAFTSIRVGAENQAKGFVPYKRCFAEREGQQSKIESEEREGRRIRLCS